MIKRFPRSRYFVFALLTALLVFPSIALADAKLVLTYPNDVPRTEVTLDVYANAPTSSTIPPNAGFPAQMVKLTPEADGSWLLKQQGTYSYYVAPVTPGKYYSVLKLIQVTQDDVDDDTLIEHQILTGPMSVAGPGYEMSWNPDLPGLPAGHTNKLDGRDRSMGIYTDEVEALYGTDDLEGYKPLTTPTFSHHPRGMYQATTQDEMMAFLRKIDAISSKAYLFSLGTSDVYNFDMPIMIITTTPIPDGATLEEAAEIIRTDGKLTIWHQAQIHANETSTGEGALATIEEMVGEYGAPFLDKIDYVVVPRFNVDGSYIYGRTDANGIDMNRDHMRLSAPQTALVHAGYLKFMPEIAIDGHEYDNYTTSRGSAIAGTADPVMYTYTSSSYTADDIESTPATSLNNPADVNDLAMRVFTKKLHEDYAAAGLWSNHYVVGSGSWTANNAIGRAYMGLMGSATFLIESRGLGGGTHNYPRRVFSHVVTSKSILETAYANADEVKAKVAAGRAAVIAKGLVYSADETLVLNQTASGNTTAPFVLPHRTINMDGTFTVRDVTMAYNDTAARVRPRPTAYVIPKGATGVDFDNLLYVLDAQKIEYYEVMPGTSADVRQYYRVTVNDTVTNAFTADLRAEATATFANGAYVVPMDQVAGTVVAMLFEPDVNNSAGYNGTVAQRSSSGAPVLVNHDTTTRDYPYYRLEKGDPRTVLPNAANKSISSFTVSGVAATINEASGTIEVTVPHGTSVTALTPTVEGNGASYTPTGAQNFSSPVTYTVTAADGSTKTYTVTVSVAPSTAKQITAFTLLGVSGMINEAAGTIAVTVPFGSTVTSATPTVTFSGASITPTGAQNFGGVPVVYTVTAGDGSTKSYSVSVTVAPNTAKAITWFSINNIAGEINETLGTITLTVPNGTDVSSAVPAIAFSGVSMTPAVGTAQNFTNPVAYIVTAGDGSTKMYTAVVNVEAPAETGGGGGSSGCNVLGFSALMIFGVLPLLKTRKK